MRSLEVIDSPDRNDVSLWIVFARPGMITPEEVAEYKNLEKCLTEIREKGMRFDSSSEDQPYLISSSFDQKQKLLLILNAVSSSDAESLIASVLKSLQGLKPKEIGIAVQSEMNLKDKEFNKKILSEIFVHLPIERVIVFQASGDYIALLNELLVVRDFIRQQNTPGFEIFH